MNRRELLLRMGTVGTVAVSGCLGSQSREQLAVEGAAPTLNSGEDAVIEVTVYNADRVSFSRLPDGQIEATDTDVSPSPDVQFDSFPPGWVWDNPQSSIEATLTVSIDSNATTNEYVYGLNAANGPREITAEFTITVDTEDG